MRHHSVHVGVFAASGGSALRCSTPCGITAFTWSCVVLIVPCSLPAQRLAASQRSRGKKQGWPLATRTAAQRLAASQRSRGNRSDGICTSCILLNALRHHSVHVVVGCASGTSPNALLNALRHHSVHVDTQRGTHEPAHSLLNALRHHSVHVDFWRWSDLAQPALLNALRHHSVHVAPIALMPRTPLGCSTPCGITAFTWL